MLRILDENNVCYNVLYYNHVKPGDYYVDPKPHNINIADDSIPSQFVALIVKKTDDSINLNSDKVDLVKETDDIKENEIKRHISDIIKEGNAWVESLRMYRSIMLTKTKEDAIDKYKSLNGLLVDPESINILYQHSRGLS